MLVMLGSATLIRFNCKPSEEKNHINTHQAFKIGELHRRLLLNTSKHLLCPSKISLKFSSEILIFNFITEFSFIQQKQYNKVNVVIVFRAKNNSLRFRRISFL